MSKVTASVNRKEVGVLLVAGEADVVRCDGVQEEPIKARQVSVHLEYTRTSFDCIGSAATDVTYWTIRIVTELE